MSNEHHHSSITLQAGYDFTTGRLIVKRQYYSLGAESGLQCVLPGRERRDELPLLSPADGWRWNTVDLTRQNGVLTLNH